MPGKSKRGSAVPEMSGQGDGGEGEGAGERPGTLPFVRVLLPGCRPKNPLNGSQGRTRGAAMAKAAERKRIRALAGLSVRAQRGTLGAGERLTVIIRRISPRPYDDDGWQAAAKPIRDGIADALGVADNDARLKWHYGQERGAPREFAVAIDLVFDRCGTVFRRLVDNALVQCMRDFGHMNAHHWEK